MAAYTKLPLLLRFKPPSTEQRLCLLWAFVVLGLVISVQISQAQADRPLQWTRLTPENKLRWFTLYILEAFLLVQNAYPLLLAKMHALAIGNEERILNAVWIGLLSVEIIMVLGVAVQSIAKRLSYRPKAKTS
jgi:fatty-acid desaturase